MADQLDCQSIKTRWWPNYSTGKILPPGETPDFNLHVSLHRPVSILAVGAQLIF